MGRNRSPGRDCAAGVPPMADPSPGSDRAAATTRKAYGGAGRRDGIVQLPGIGQSRRRQRGLARAESVVALVLCNWGFPNDRFEPAAGMCRRRQRGRLRAEPIAVPAFCNWGFLLGRPEPWIGHCRCRQRGRRRAELAFVWGSFNWGFVNGGLQLCV